MMIAEARDIPLDPGDPHPVRKRFDPRVKRSVGRAKVYGYMDQLLGRPVRVYLSLTPTSKKLYRVGIHFPSLQVEKTRKEVLETLVGKYGRPSFKRKKELLFGETVWRAGKSTEIVMVYGFGSLKVVYEDRALAGLKAREKEKLEAEEREAHEAEDSHKF